MLDIESRCRVEPRHVSAWVADETVGAREKLCYQCTPMNAHRARYYFWFPKPQAEEGARSP
jgi:hypothetical protein